MDTSKTNRAVKEPSTLGRVMDDKYHLASRFGRIPHGMQDHLGLFRVLDQLVEHGVLRNAFLLRHFQEMLVGARIHSESKSDGATHSNRLGTGFGRSGFLFDWCCAFLHGSFRFFRGGTFNDFTGFLFWHDFSGG